MMYLLIDAGISGDDVLAAERLKEN